MTPANCAKTGNMNPNAPAVARAVRRVTNPATISASVTTKHTYPMSRTW